MGVGHYSETDARSSEGFTGWNSQNLVFYIDEEFGGETFSRKEGNFSGTDIIDLILEQPVTAEFIAANISVFCK